MSSFFSIPDKEKDYKSYMVFVLCILWTAVIAVIISFGFLFLPHLWLRWLIFLATSLFVFIINFTLNQLGYTRLASILLTILIWLFITIPCYTAGGISAPGILSQTSVILTAGFLLGGLGGLAIGLLTMGVDFWMAYLEVNGNLPIPSVVHTPITLWIGAIIPFGTILALQYYATNHLRSGLIALQHEILKREEAEKITNQTLHNLEERVKELKTLHGVSHLLQDEDAPLKTMLSEIAKILSAGWQYPDITAARVCYSGVEFATSNYKPSPYCQQAEVKTGSGSILSIEVVYLQQTPEMDEGPFLKEERNLINMLTEMVRMYLERRERKAELKDYKYAIDVASMVSISQANGKFSYVNDNFCKTSKYSSDELLGKDNSMIVSSFHSPEYLRVLIMALQNGRTYTGEFCNQAKDGTLYWVDTTIVPFLDEDGKVYQYLSISHDITESKEANDKIKRSESLLKKITSQIPSNTYLFEIDENGDFKIHFVSRGIDAFNYNFDVEEVSVSPERLEEALHKDDKVKFKNKMKEAYRMRLPFSFQFRVIVDENVRWRWIQAVPEKDEHGKILWYGATSDITPLVEYLVSIEQILFDIGHVIRRPVSTMLGLSKLIIDGKLKREEIKEIVPKLYQISEEMDKFLKELNRVYQEKSQSMQHNIDISSLIDKRGSLFN